MVSKFIGAVFVLSLIAGAARAQTACPPSARPSVPDPIAYSDLSSDRVFYTEATQSAVTVIRKASADATSPTAPSNANGFTINAATAGAPLYVAYGVDVGNKRILFQITFSSDAELTAFQTRLNSNLNVLAEENAAQDLPFNWIISSNVGSKVPPAPPGGPNGLPYAEYLGGRLVQLGEAFNATQSLALSAN